MIRTIRVLGSLFVGLVLVSSPLFAQGASTASIAGTVRDSSGSVLPGVTVTSTQTETGLERTAVSDAEGRYLISNLPVGPYRLEFMLAGFRTFVQTGTVLQVNGSPTINAALEIGAVEESVTVQGESPLIETRSVGIGMVVDNQRVLELPLNGRETLDLVFMTGMAVSSGTLGGARGGATSTSPGNDRRGRGAGERHLVHARWRDAQRSVQQCLDAAALSGGAPGIQGGDQRAAGSVWISLGRGGQRGDQIRDEFGLWHALRVRPRRCVERQRPVRPARPGRQAPQRRPESQSVRRRDRRPHPQGPHVLLRRLSAHQNPAGSCIHVPVRADTRDDGRRFHRHHVGGVQHRRGDPAEERVREQQDRPGAVFSCVGETGEPAAGAGQSLRPGVLRPHRKQ